MATIKIKDISADFANALDGHFKTYVGKPNEKIINGDYTESTTGTYKIEVDSIEFLNTQGKADAYITRDEETILFCIKPKIEKRKFADYFPQMVPKDPWITTDNAELAFPNFANREITKIEWIYVFAYSTKENIIISAELAKKFYTVLGKDERFIPLLQSISKGDSLNRAETGWKGGLFYFGTLPELPASNMIPGPIKDLWEMVLDKIDMQGCVYHKGIIPHLKLLIPIVRLTKPFGDVVRNLEIVTIFSSPLNAIEQTQPIEIIEGKKIKLAQKREVGIDGFINFGSQNIAIIGVFPLDEDLILIEVKSSLADLTSYLDQSSPLNSLIPEKIEPSLKFKVSKQNKKIESINFDFNIENWKLIENVFELKAVNFNCTIFYPGKINQMSAKFTSDVKIGSVYVLGEGNFPNGEVKLYLNPTKPPILLNDIVNVFSKNTNFFGNKAINELEGSYDLENKYFSFTIGIGNTSWKAADDLDFTLDNLRLSVFGKGNYTFKLVAKFNYTINHKPITFIGTADYDETWQFRGDCFAANLSMGDLVEGFGIAKDDVPNQLSKFQFKALTFAFAAKEKLKYFGGRFKINLFKQDIDLDLQVKKLDTITYFTGDFSTKINDKDAKFKVEFEKQPNGHKIGLQMLFNLAGVDIYLAAKSETSGKGEEKISEKYFEGGTNGLSISLTKLLEQLLDGAFGVNFPAVFLPELSLNDVYITYNGANAATNIIAFANISGKKVRFYLQSQSVADKKATNYVFGIDTDVDSLSKLPLVGEEMKEVNLNGVGFIYTTVEGEYQLPKLSAPNANGICTIKFADKATYKKGVTLLGHINLPNDESPISLTLPISRSSRSLALKSSKQNIALRGASDSFEPAVKWININKKIGPVAVNRVGFNFADGQLSLLISGALMLADLAINVEGLGLSFSPTKLIKGENVEPAFKLSGLGLAFDRKPLEISGMLMRTTPKDNESISFYGAAQISTANFNIKGIGAYAKLNDVAKTDSLFIYGVYNGPIGGPAVFFITGIAAGFGYNRTIRIPKLEEVKDFPLVSMVLSGKPKTDREILAELIDNNWIPASAGDYWMAVGVKFTSFKIIESFVLLTIKFGGKVEFAIIGLSLLKWPSEGTAIVYIELALLARFGPDSDVIAVTGMLTPNSYILDKNCKLTGGFAFYTWISGEHEGDFVITLGGYKTNYKIPAHYPVVDRLALNWKISDALSIKGEMYYALTPREIMAGGRWEIAYNLSFLSARVTMWADMIIAWAPFHYEFSAGIIVRIEANIKVLFVHIHFKLQMGCEVQIWGPPFAGQIYVDWSILSFTIPFGDGGRPKEIPMVWGNTTLKSAGKLNDEKVVGFKESFVPAQILDARIVSGAINQPPGEEKGKLQGKDKPAVLEVNAYNLVIAVDSFFPVTTLHSPRKEVLSKGLHTNDSPCKPVSTSTLMDVAGLNVPKTVADSEKEFGIKPLNIDNLDTELHAWLELENGNGTNTPIEENVTIIGTAKGINSALWQAVPPTNKKGKLKEISKEEKPVIKNVLTGLQLHVVEKNAKLTSVDLSNRFTLLDPKATVSFFRGADSAVQDGGPKKMIKASLAANKSKSSVDELISLGFTELFKDSKALLYSEVLNSDPVYIVSIGQLLPINPIA
ncbi:hypothetical protein FA048_16465 [Pedobacter polaris]|uniref:DUF6603 domain-containing protein n=1 Tax=Pedobacter polaris TaxID=2571273 RepID=A0A4U1CJ90_9SPHI|nr:DUF6603 domain-containing protein [Pedobacter polaris]TKC06790.1 hypothetical protein FA048_16465 [Pedobacter polaris]